jgi:hypothetical protein
MSKLTKQLTEISLTWLAEDDMPEDMDTAATQISDISSKGIKALVMAYWNIGKIIQHIKTQFAEDHEGSSRGSGAVETLAAKTGINDRTLYCCNKLFLQHTSEEAIERVSALDWSVLRTLQSVQDPTTREELETRALEENWSVRDTEKEVKEYTAPELGTSQLNQMLAEEEEVEEEIDPSIYFENIESLLRSQLASLQKELTPCAAMKAILDDANAINEEDLEKAEEHIAKCLDLSHSIVTFCTIHIIQSLSLEE